MKTTQTTTERLLAKLAEAKALRIEAESKSNAAIKSLAVTQKRFDELNVKNVLIAKIKKVNANIKRIDDKIKKEESN